MTSSIDKSLKDLPLLDLLSNNLMDGVYLIDPASSNILWVNRAGYEALQMQEEELLHHSVLSLQKDVIGIQQWHSIAEVIRQNKQFTFIGRHMRKDGTELPVEVNTSVFTHDGCEFFLSIARDISRRREQEAEVQGREEQIWLALNSCTDGLWDWDISSGHVYFSPQLKRMLGYGPDEMKPVVDTWKNNVFEEDQPMVLQALEEHIQGKRDRYEAVYRMRNRNGHMIWVHDLGSVSLRTSEGEPIRVTGMVKDITDYKQQEFKLQELAAYDELTKLRNRRECTRIFDKQLNFAQRNDQPLSLCFFDFDYFKSINDQYGHMAGDYVLKETAKFLTENLRVSDYLFRWGGEEFILISANTTRQEMQVLAENLRAKLANLLLDYDGQSIHVTGSFGIASYPQHGESQSELILAADSALYQAKSDGRNCVRLFQQ
ncbi:sensor domain-containing diguanylate cyclase [Neptuniibacter caesariensis]|uniref:Diguanylate cyclase/phosphodiesterase domain 1 (GGDEF) n=1 Tax=Neptuniibacter caesariensis TaxID=207954 RepID=A0A7U8C3R9_NEPCE|nr:sensor domain-containing diguanylate cyclase [Neptuniibacter caesariensis]EAR60960.1 Diguanylate cyclase/phosphodiesterase domain 1 (GGDEF) [Oceanospirillum sp. MED92] [Neptuniibacter caesariensis]